MDPNDKFILPYKSTPSSHLAEREPIVPTSRVLGGGSSVNMLLYSRPQRSELDAWNTPGWSADEILSYMKKASPGGQHNSTAQPAEYSQV